MKIALFGATGHAGKYILHEALHAGYEVTVLVRHPEKLQPQKNLHIVKGDALNMEDVLTAIQGQEAVVSAISEGPEIVHKTQSKAVQYMLQAMKQANVQRIICMGANGILQFNEQELLRDQPSYPSLYKPLSYEHSAVNEQLRQSGLQWTQVCPPTIVAAPADGKFLVKEDYLPSNNMEANAGNIGLFMMQELKQNKFIGKKVGLTNE